MSSFFLSTQQLYIVGLFQRQIDSKTFTVAAGDGTLLMILEPFGKMFGVSAVATC